MSVKVLSESPLKRNQWLGELMHQYAHVRAPACVREGFSDKQTFILQMS